MERRQTEDEQKVIGREENEWKMNGRQMED